MRETCQCPSTVKRSILVLMTNTWNTKGIVLTYTPYSETDRLYTIYTERFGKQVMRAHGSRKITSKLAGSLEPFAEIDVYMIQARSLNKIGGAVVLHRFKTITQHTDRMNAAHFVVDLIDRLTREDARDTTLYALLYSTLTWIDHHPSQRTVLYSFAVKVAQMLGDDLSHHTQHEEIQKILRWLTTAEFSEVQKLRMSQTQWQAIHSVIHAWLFDQTSQHIHTQNFLV